VGIGATWLQQSQAVPVATNVTPRDVPVIVALMVFDPGAGPSVQLVVATPVLSLTAGFGLALPPPW